MTNTVNLKKHQLFWFRAPTQAGSGDGVVQNQSSAPIVIQKGQAWVTIKGCEKDYILSEGEALPMMTEDILIEALTDQLIMTTIQREPRADLI